MTVVSTIAERIAGRWSVPPADIEIEPLTGGLVNEVYRVRAGDRSAIVKHALPHVAAAPQIALSPRRSTIEARCLRELGPGGRLESIATSHVRAPYLLEELSELAAIVIEDLGTLPDLGTTTHIDPRHGRDLGEFLARLHVASREAPDLLDEVVNHEVQSTRYQAQHTQVSTWLEAWGRTDNRALGASAAEVGRRLRGRGSSLIMGDLWLPSVLVAGESLRVIDWEFAHAGTPAQDLGHILAHLWMHEQRASAERATAYQRLRRNLITTYAAGSGLADHQFVGDACRHAGCEILARVLGPFRGSFLYSSLRPDDPDVIRAIDLACAALQGDETLWSA